MSNVTLTANVPVDLYAATGITVGTQLRVSNISTSDVRLSTSELGLDNDHIVMNMYEQAVNKSGDSGAWAVSKSDGAINIVEA